ncbi:hypothetical protein M011DRAFT_222797 [Sporormia fimetaria CBS 119925]|uniref:Uncharacterized protein n=1 Tax=Sporormia fimetaria CBS 119925 TaxID=1340428 RepID=A0A6A6UZU5_9PLEO|nr:hypothetical protein M011DRAFT_222797 [Sporormia fimetaria CBS 119925]
MLSRKSSDAGTRLRRSKSTTTTHTHRFAAPEPLNLEVAQKHAVAAATTAFVRAHAGGVTERNHGRTIEIRRAQSNNGRKAQGHRFLQREASLRSADAQKAGRSVGHRSHVSAAAIEKFTVSAVTPGTERSLDTQPSMASSENLRPSSQPKPHRPNASSSLASQQIRKARSMYYASSVQTGSPVPRPPVKYLTTPPTSPRHENPPLSPCTGDGSLLSAQAAHGHANEHTKSASLPLVSPRVPVTVVPNEAMNRERDRYLKDFQQRQVKQKPSLFLAPFKKRQDKGKEKLAPPVQPSMATDPGTTEGSPDTALPEFRPLREKRSISDSLRSKFKKVFGRVSNKPSTVPAQQTKASRDYFGYHSHRSSAPNAGLSGLEIPSPDEHTLRRARSRSSSLDGGRAALMRPSSRGSTRSLHSEVNMSNATSRVTSWSNSSVGDTLTQRALKRLTVIHEAKDSISSDPGHLIVPKPEEQQPPPAPGLAAFREPMPADYLLTDNNLTVDPKRVFSALMREIDGAKGVHNQGSSAARPGSVGHDVFASSPLANSTLDAHGAVDPVNNMNSAGGTSGSPVVLTDKNPGSVPAASKAASLGRRSFRSWGRVLKATIRNVTPSENDVTVLTTSGHLKGNIEVSKSMPTSVRSPSTIPEQNYQEEDYTYGSIDLLSKNATDANSANHTPSRHQIEARVARSHARWKSPLERQATSSVSPIVEASLASTPRHVPSALKVCGIPKSLSHCGDNKWQNQCSRHYLRASTLAIQTAKASSRVTVLPHLVEVPKADVPRSLSLGLRSSSPVTRSRALYSGHQLPNEQPTRHAPAGTGGLGYLMRFPSSRISPTSRFRSTNITAHLEPIDASIRRSMRRETPP